MATHPKVLGLTLDPELTYSTHIYNISVHAHKPLQIIKALTATGWGKQNETLMATYKAVMRPALEYASSIWSPFASSTSINKLQVMQNSALRTATGCTQDTNIQHLHDETLTLPIHEHLHHGEWYVVSNECDEPTSCLVQPIGAHCCEVMYFGCFDFMGEIGILNCDDICVCVVNKHFELLEFVFGTVYVDLQYDEISLTFTAGSVCLCGVCSHVIVIGLSVRLSWYPMGCGGCCDCDACTVVCVC